MFSGRSVFVLKSRVSSSVPTKFFIIKLRCLAEKSFKSWRPNRSTPVNTCASPSRVSPNTDNNQVSDYVKKKSWYINCILS